MSGVRRFLVISIGGTLLLMVVGMCIALFLTTPEEVKGVDLIADWVWFRVFAYAAILVAWQPLCRMLTRPKRSIDNAEDAYEGDVENLRQQDLHYLYRLRWKVAAILAFIEIVIIQQFGL